jgi:hypothetical protein
MEQQLIQEKMVNFFKEVSKTEKVLKVNLLFIRDFFQIKH